jgi:hypothetical protein
MPLPTVHNSVDYLELVQALRAKQLYQNLPDGVIATLSDCKNLVDHFDLEQLASLSDSTLFDALLAVVTVLAVLYS